MPAPVWGVGGTGPDAIAALYAHLLDHCGARAGRAGRQAGPWLMAPDADAYTAAVARLRVVPESVDVIIATSGSTDGRGHLVGLTMDALLASASATLNRLGGPGQWVTSLPLHGVAGFQVVLRSAVAGIPPVVYSPSSGFDAGLLERAVAALGPGRAYLSLVPTQLHAALEVGAPGLARFDAVLVGGAALAPELAARAATAGVRVVTTYGSTETAGGCVYDGLPLEGVRVRIRDDAEAPSPTAPGRILLAGPMLADGYLDVAPDAQPFVYEDGQRWLVTSDLGTLSEGRLRVLGRADDVVISGGTNVAPQVVEEALATLGGEWLVVGVPDPHWGQRITAVTTHPDADLNAARAATAALRPAERPRALVRVATLPMRPTGKPDRRAAAQLAATLQALGQAETR